MAPRRSKPSAPKSPSSTTLPPPFKPLPASLQPFTSALSKKHIYLTHIDTKPASFKLKIFLVPVALNLAVVLLAIWRIRSISPWYGALMLSTLGYTPDTAVLSSPSSTSLAYVILSRATTFLIDFLLIIFIYPWPVEFCLAKTHANPLLWRLRVGFRPKEIYVRRSRDWDAGLTDAVFASLEKRKFLLSKVYPATDSLLLQTKTGYLTMNADWDLDWAAMIFATKLADGGTVPLEAFERAVVFHTREHGWVCVDRGAGEDAKEDKRRRQVFAFRDALAAVGKEDLFFRWIEIVQFEVSQPGGFSAEKQVEVAGRIREMFAREGLDFDEFWKESVGSEGLAGMD